MGKRRADERTRTADLLQLRVSCYICPAMPLCPEKAHKQANFHDLSVNTIRQILPNIACIVVKIVVKFQAPKRLNFASSLWLSSCYGNATSPGNWYYRNAYLIES